MARNTPEINSSSMADIAFLLLIFFLVTTTMDVDTGIYKKLPPIPDENQVDDNVKVKKRNVLSILVNRNNELLVNGEVLSISNLREKTKEFFLNPANNENLPEKGLKNVPYFGDVMVSKGLISLQNDRGTRYETYIRVQDELAAASRELKDEKAVQKWGKKYTELNADQQEAVRKYIPVQISEAEPRNTGGK